jgi:hypothetical protein
MEAKMNQIGQNPNVAQQKPVVLLKLALTADEASMVLNKLNVSQFVGFSESALAMSVLAKLQSAERVTQDNLGPSVDQLRNVKETRTPNKKQLQSVLNKVAAEKTAEKVAAPVTDRRAQFTKPTSVVKEIKEDLEDESLSGDDDDSRPGAPLKALDEAREETSPAKESIPPEDAGIFSVIDKSKNKKDGTDSYI